MDTKKISTALISVYDKTGLEEVVTLLNKNGVLIYSTGGTYDFIKKLGIHHPRAEFARSTHTS